MNGQIHDEPFERLVERKERGAMAVQRKSLMLVVAMFMALGGLIPGAAQAVETDLTAGVANGILESTPTAEHVMVTEAGEIRCKAATVKGNYTATTITSFTIAMSYTSCKAFGFLTATVTQHGCEYLYAAKGEENTKAKLSIINCTNANKDITVATAGCTVHIEEQGPLGGVVFTNGTGDVDMAVNLTGLKYTATAGGTCAGGGTGKTQSNGTTSYSVTIKAFSGGGQVELAAN